MDTMQSATRGARDTGRNTGRGASQRGGRRRRVGRAAALFDARAYWIVVAMLVLAALAGGASRAAAFSQMVVRGGEGGLLALLLVASAPVEWRSLRWPLLFMATVTIVLGAMLVPLPPEVWTGLPGRGLIAQAAPLAGMAQPWRPFAIVPPLAWNAFFALIPPAAVLIGLIHLTPEERARLVWPMAMLIAASALLGVAQLGGGADSGLRWYANQSRDAGVGFFANRNHQALFLAMGFPVLALWATGGAVRWPGAPVRAGAAIGAAVVVALSLLSTGSRAGLLLGALALIGTGLGLAGPARAGFARLPTRLRTAALAAAAGLVALVAAVALLSPQARSLTRLFTLDVTQDLRAMAWPTLERVVATYFPAGTGFGGFERAFRAAEPFSMLKRTYFNAAHNDYLQVAIEGGAVGLALIAAFVVWWLVQGARLWRHAGDAVWRRTAAAGWLMVLLVLVASALDYPMRTPLMMVVLVVACGWIALPRASGVAEADKGRRSEALYDQEREPYSDGE